MPLALRCRICLGEGQGPGLRLLNTPSRLARGVPLPMRPYPLPPVLGAPLEEKQVAFPCAGLTEDLLEDVCAAVLTVLPISQLENGGIMFPPYRKQLRSYGAWTMSLATAPLTYIPTPTCIFQLSQAPCLAMAWPVHILLILYTIAEFCILCVEAEAKAWA